MWKGNNSYLPDGYAKGHYSFLMQILDELDELYPVHNNSSAHRHGTSYLVYPLGSSVDSRFITSPYG